jgi:hypothetical protein
MPKENILQEALRLTSTERRNDYGHPKEDFKRTAAVSTILLGKEITPSDVVLILIAMKLSRNAHQYKRDTLVDVAGYSRVLAIIKGEEDA